MTHRNLLVLALVTCFVVPSLAGAQAQRQGRWNPPMAERLKMPGYCQAQYDPEFRKQMRIPTPMEMCGVGMNHFCPGLYLLNQAGNAALPRQDRRDALSQAVIELNYTKQRIPPDCVFMQDFQNAMARLSVLSQLLK